MRDFADVLAHQQIPEEFLECLLTRRHVFPMAKQHRQRVRYSFGPGDVLDLTEYSGDCERCGMTRTLWRDQQDFYVGAKYDRPDGYDPPPGLLWDRESLWLEYHRRHPIKGKLKIIDRSR